MTVRIETKCYVCGDIVDLNRSGLFQSPNSKRRSTQRFPLCSQCFEPVKRFLNSQRGKNEE